METSITRARPSDAVAVAQLAAATFPLACPPGTDPGDITDFVADHLSPAAFTRMLADPDWLCLLARTEGGELVGYTLTGFGSHAWEPDADGVEPAGTCLLSKCYVRPEAHGGQVAGALLAETLRTATARGAATCWLGVNQLNERAQRFYRKHGFKVVGRRTFTVGRQTHQDYVMSRSLGALGEAEAT